MASTAVTLELTRVTPIDFESTILRSHTTPSHTPFPYNGISDMAAGYQTGDLWVNIENGIICICRKLAQTEARTRSSNRGNVLGRRLSQT